MVLAFFLRIIVGERCRAVKITETQELNADLSKTLKEFREGFMGIRPTYVRVVAGVREIAFLLEEVLSPAEQQTVSSPMGRRMMQELGDHRIERAGPQLERLVEQALDERMILVTVHLDVAVEASWGSSRLSDQTVFVPEEAMPVLTGLHDSCGRPQPERGATHLAGQTLQRSSNSVHYSVLVVR